MSYDLLGRDRSHRAPFRAPGKRAYPWLNGEGWYQVDQATERTPKTGRQLFDSAPGAHGTRTWGDLDDDDRFLYDGDAFADSVRGRLTPEENVELLRLLRYHFDAKLKK